MAYPHSVDKLTKYSTNGAFKLVEQAQMSNFFCKKKFSNELFLTLLSHNNIIKYKKN